MKTVGVVDTTFSRVDMGAVAVTELEQFAKKNNWPCKILRRTVPGFKDLAVECIRFHDEENFDICMAIGWVGGVPIDTQCAHEAATAIASAQLMLRKHIRVRGARVLVLGLTFKENCTDVRNTRVVDIVRELESFGARVDVHDPWVKSAEAEHEYGIRPVARPRRGTYDAIVLAVAHRQFREMGVRALRAYGRPAHVLYDIKSVLPRAAVDERL